MSYAAIIQDLPPELQPTLLKLVETVEQNIRQQLAVRREDFEALQSVVHELAEAQKRTEQRLGRTEEHLDRIEAAIERLVEAQAHTEEEQAMLEKTAEQAATSTRPKFPRQGEWTYEDWLKFPNDGWKYEIIDGILYCRRSNIQFLKG